MEETFLLIIIFSISIRNLVLVLLMWSIFSVIVGTGPRCWSLLQISKEPPGYLPVVQRDTFLAHPHHPKGWWYWGFSGILWDRWSYGLDQILGRYRRDHDFRFIHKTTSSQLNAFTTSSEDVEWSPGMKDSPLVSDLQWQQLSHQGTNMQSGVQASH